MLQNESRKNYSRRGLYYDSTIINERPLYLFAIELELNLDKKHLMGDFLNGLMLARYPIVVVPDSNLSKCFDILKIMHFVFDVKKVNVEHMFQKVMILNMSQFTRILNTLLTSNMIPEINLKDYFTRRGTLV